ncbi:heme exporter protein CcmD [uncultured Parasphingorhabdus sp.]|tara:strand:- start:12534 stop:12665 length:132 start_codon:yes stop_codon:yes gene_type:complete
MNHWPFVFASYAIVLIGTAAVIVNSFVAMRRAERKAEQLSKRK